jgi:hypothetical protein
VILSALTVLPNTLDFGFERTRKVLIEITTHPKIRYLIIHGEDAPVPNWKTRIKACFRLKGVGVSALSDVREQGLDEDRRAVEDALGVSLDFGQSF